MQESLPVVHIKLQILAVAGGSKSVGCIVGICSLNRECGFDVGKVFVAYLEVERSDIDRNRYIGIVGLHVGQMVYLLSILVSLST